MRKFNPKKILVTGGAGFIGCNYIRYLLSQDAQVSIINLDKLTYAGSLNNLKNLPNEANHVFVQGDICDRELVADLFKEYSIDTVVHFAAESHVDRSIIEPEDFVQTNMLGTFTLLEAARQNWLHDNHYSQHECCFHHISTDEVFGTLKLNDAPFNEQTPYSPNSPYSASKAGADHLVRAYYATYKLPITLTNCSNNYGPFQHEEKFIPTVIRACLKNQSIPIYGTGKNIRDWLYVEDHCKMIHAIICYAQVGESYNIGGENEIDNLTLVKKICTLMDKLSPKNKPHADLITFVEDRRGHDFRYAIDMDKLKKAKLWQAPTCFEEALRKTITFYST